MRVELQVKTRVKTPETMLNLLKNNPSFSLAEVAAPICNDRLVISERRIENIDNVVVIYKSNSLRQVKATNRGVAV